MQSTSSPQIRALLRGSSLVGHSSHTLGWEGFAIERHKVDPGEKSETLLEQHFVAVWTAGLSYGEHPNLRGKFVAFSKRAGSVTLLPTGIAPALRLASPSEITVTAFTPEFIAGIKNEIEGSLSTPFLGKLTFDEPALLSLMSLLMKECAAGNPHGRIYADSLAHAMGTRFLYFAKGERWQEPTYRHAESPHAIRRVLDRMHTEFDVDLSLQTLASESGYSRRHFLRVFEEATGYTPHQYLLRLRIERAKELLRKKLVPLVDVAASSGFSSQAHMSKIFRKYCGATPVQIRRSLI